MNLTTVNHVCNNLLFKRILHTSPSDYWPLLLIVIGRCIFFHAFKCERIDVSADWIWPTTTTASSSLFPADFFIRFYVFPPFFFVKLVFIIPVYRIRFVQYSLFSMKFPLFMGWWLSSHVAAVLFSISVLFMDRVWAIMFKYELVRSFLHELYSTLS